MKKILNTAIFYFILAIIAGVFYREFTKLNGYIGITALSYVHTHFFALGMIFFLLILALGKGEQSLLNDKMFNKFFVLYNISLPLMAFMMLIRGITQVKNIELSNVENSIISGISGIAHILITISFIMFFSVLKRHIIKHRM